MSETNDTINYSIPSNELLKPKKENNTKEREIIQSKNFNIIKNALFKLKNKKIENIIKKSDDTTKKEKKEFINKKRKNSEENEAINNRDDIIEENIEDKLNKNTIDIKENEKIEINDNDNSDEDIDDKIEEEDEESFSITSNDNQNSINSESIKINKKRRKKYYKKNDDKISKINSKMNKINTVNYKKGNKRTILKRKKYYVYQLLQRWWYTLPKWPPENLDMSEKLKENKLRLVEEKNWKKEVEINSDDFKKCIELPGYKYIYITKDGKVYDFRPEKDKPSFNNLMKFSDIELHKHLVNALKKQLEELDKRNYFSEKNLRQNIRNQLAIAKLNLKRIQKK